MRWRDVSPELYARMQGSNSTQVLTPELYPPGFEKIANLQSVCVWRTTATTKFVSDGTTITNIVGGLDVFRAGTKPGDPTLKSERYLIAESTDSRVSMIGPIKDVPHGHYPATLPPWAVKRSRLSTGW